MIRLSAVALATVLLPFFAVAREPAAPIIGRANVIDGDTIEIRGRHIRLFGIDGGPPDLH